MVRVWGRWCGPNWTAGRAIPAKDYDWQNDPSPTANDELDFACKIHDRAYGDGGDRKKADKLLQKTAANIARDRPLSAEGLAAAGVAVAMELKEWVE